MASKPGEALIAILGRPKKGPGAKPMDEEEPSKPDLGDEGDDDLKASLGDELSDALRARDGMRVFEAIDAILKECSGHDEEE